MQQRQQRLGRPALEHRPSPHLHSSTKKLLGRSDVGHPARQPAPGAVAHDARTAKPFPLVAIFFLFAVSVPWVMTVGSIKMPTYRAVLFIAFLPCLLKWLGGRAGRIRLADWAFLLFCVWCGVSILVIHGMENAIQPIGAIFVDTFAAWLLGRCAVRDAESFHKMVWVLFWVIAATLPLALVESFTGQNITQQLFGSVFPTPADVYMPPRWGMRRVQAGFLHPILYGIFAVSGFALVHFVLGWERSGFKRWTRSSIVLAAAFLSLSSGPLSGLAGQLGLMLWAALMRGVSQKWWLLIGMLATALLIIAVVANRPLPVILMGYFAFDEASAYIRVLTWRYGTESIAAHPLFGVGFGDWARPPWLTSSVDMFWIVDSLRHGLPAGLLLATGFFGTLLPVAFAKGLSDKESAYRLGYLFVMIGLFLSGWAVYYWEAVYALFIFLLASGAWMAEARIQGHEVKPVHVPAKHHAERRRMKRKSQATGASA